MGIDVKKWKRHHSLTAPSGRNWCFRIVRFRFGEKYGDLGIGWCNRGSNLPVNAYLSLAIAYRPQHTRLWHPYCVDCELENLLAVFGPEKTGTPISMIKNEDLQADCQAFVKDIYARRIIAFYRQRPSAGDIVVGYNFEINKTTKNGIRLLQPDAWRKILTAARGERFSVAQARENAPNSGVLEKMWEAGIKAKGIDARISSYCEKKFKKYLDIDPFVGFYECVDAICGVREESSYGLLPERQLTLFEFISAVRDLAYLSRLLCGAADRYDFLLFGFWLARHKYLAPSQRDKMLARLQDGWRSVDELEASVKEAACECLQALRLKYFQGRCRDILCAMLYDLYREILHKAIGAGSICFYCGNRLDRVDQHHPFCRNDHGGDVCRKLIRQKRLDTRNRDRRLEANDLRQTVKDIIRKTMDSGKKLAPDKLELYCKIVNQIQRRPNTSREDVIVKIEQDDYSRNEVEGAFARLVKNRLIEVSEKYQEPACRLSPEKFPED